MLRVSWIEFGIDGASYHHLPINPESYQIIGDYLDLYQGLVKIKTGRGQILPLPEITFAVGPFAWTGPSVRPDACCGCRCCNPHGHCEGSHVLTRQHI